MESQAGLARGGSPVDFSLAGDAVVRKCDLVSRHLSFRSHQSECGAGNGCALCADRSALAAYRCRDRSCGRRSRTNRRAFADLCVHADGGAVGGHFVPWHPDRGCHAARWRSIGVDRADTRPVQLGLALLDAIVRRHPDEFSWTHYPTAANPTGADHFARLIGRGDVHAAIGEQSRADRVGLTAVPDWRARCASARLY